MSYALLTDFKAVLRNVDGTSASDATYQNALDSAEAAVSKFIGFNPSDEFETVPPAILSACYILAAVEVDALDVPTEQQRRGRAKALLRPYRRETGFTAAGEAA